MGTSIVVSSVNTSTEEITVTAHGLFTGDRFRLRNVGGALPAATPSLAPVTDYFALRTGPDTLKICDTNAHALAGTGIVNLTGSGSGSTFLEYGLPYCVPRIAAPGTQVFSADDNAQWQSLVALHAHFTQQAQSVWSAPSPQRFTIIGAAGVEQDPDKTKVLRVGPQLRFAATRTGTNGVLYPLQLPVGAVLSAMQFVYNRAGNTLAFSIVAQDLDTGASTSSAQALVNDSSTTGVQAATVSNFAVDGSGHPTGAAGALTARADRAYWILLECTYTSGTPIVYGMAINP